MTYIFEKLSGSLEFKQKFDELKKEIRSQENEMKLRSEKLKEYRHEKIKIKGLSEFQGQIDQCMKE
jgi:hypothetical protein